MISGEPTKLVGLLNQSSAGRERQVRRRERCLAIPCRKRAMPGRARLGKKYAGFRAIAPRSRLRKPATYHDVIECLHVRKNYSEPRLIGVGRVHALESILRIG